MRHSVALLAAVCLFNVAGGSGIAARQAQTAGTKQATIDATLAAVRADLLANRRETMAKNLTLTADQAAKFWPIYEKYEKEMTAIFEYQMQGIQRYNEAFDSLDDAGALSLIKAHLDRDEMMNAMRLKALVELQRAVGTKLAARAVQIDRRLSLAYQLEIAAKIPLIR